MLNEPIQPIHLGDGAYVTFTGYSFLLTANHHDPNQATDTVSIDVGDVPNLIAYMEKCGIKIPTTQGDG